MDEGQQSQLSLDERAKTRPALRPVPIADPPPGRKTLPGDWYRREDMPAGTTLRWREEVRTMRARAAASRKHVHRLTWDQKAQNTARHVAQFLFESEPERLWAPSVVTRTASKPASTTPKPVPP